MLSLEILKSTTEILQKATAAKLANLHSTDYSVVGALRSRSTPKLLKNYV